MGKDSKPKDAGAKGKGKGKQAGGGSDENASKGKGKSGKASDGLGTCTYVKGLRAHTLGIKLCGLMFYLVSVCLSFARGNTQDFGIQISCPLDMSYKPSSKVNEAYQKLQDGWLSNGDKVPPAEFAKPASEYSECPSGKKGGDLGWFPRGKMAGPFQDVAFSTQIGATSAPFKSTYVSPFSNCPIVSTARIILTITCYAAESLCFYMQTIFHQKE
ncbi:hypothetical protein DKX38_016039 [Salix brachista]|uniref:Peptidyl-prolyl cis-trans isomerase n=1 Tax=Salix brachista TaxID=2182728 RepID=A0A5N5L8Z7_9ROSI|nr:hypothetical protein DKX38_016039 [Salix brachista]